MRRFLLVLTLLIAGLAAFALWMTRAAPLTAADLPALSGDAQAGRAIFLAAGCATCHASRDTAGEARPTLSGGRRLSTAYGTFVAPNISPDPAHGIGGYDFAGLVSVLRLGVSPDGQHLFPVMPYTSYARMSLQDIADLKAWLDELPASDAPDRPHELALPRSLRQGIGLWKERYLDPGFIGAAPSAQVERGRYLVEGPGHCAECHTPRDRFGGLERHRWMAGGDGLAAQAPNITPAALGWSREEIVWYLESGHGPDGARASHGMEEILAGLGQLPRTDLEAIATYLKGLAPVR
ncbi:MAG: cytochrome c [Tropicimonas sp.]|uniref:cytochrome c n=1 Tax=Tropicimonas sp. TaxID=2067044 RepID=UPI003A8B13DD